MNKITFEKFCKYIYVVDKRTGKAKKFTFNKAQYEMLHKFNILIGKE